MTTTLNTDLHAEFLRKIELSDRSDRTPYGIYADYLEEQQAPDAAVRLMRNAYRFGGCYNDALRAAILTLLADAPAAPVTGPGNVRTEFGRVRKGQWERIWDMVPVRHKHQLSYSKGGSMRWRGTRSNIVISPEAAEVIDRLYCPR